MAAGGGPGERRVWYETEQGTPQGSGVSPILANIFLHYALDLWVHQWRRRHARGRVVIVRDADDFVMGFEREADAQPMRVALGERLARFRLALHPDKTRLIEFGYRPWLVAAPVCGIRRPSRSLGSPTTVAGPGTVALS